MRELFWSKLSHWVVNWARTSGQHDPMEVMISPTTQRLRGIGLFIIVNHLVFGLVWLVLAPQSFDSVPMRALLAATGLPFVVGPLSRNPQSPHTLRLLSLALWLHLPLVFSFLFVMNDGNGVRLASMVGVIMVYYQVTDWRIATVGTLAGMALGGGIGYLMHTPDFESPYGSFSVLLFMWAGAIFLGVSRANLRRAQFTQTVHTMTVMANDMRPAIAAMSIVGKALRDESRATASPLQADRLSAWGNKLLKLSSFIRATLASQVANAHLLEMGLPADTELLRASALVTEVVRSYPYLKYTERACVKVSIRRDFSFVGSHRQFSQVLSNMIRNSLSALAATQRTLIPGDVLLEVGVLAGRGRIVVTDRGVGMTPESLQRAFEAFYTTDRRMGHGLGLTFNRQIVEAAGGSISVESVWGFGACFTIEFPRISPGSNTLSSESFPDSSEQPSGN